MTQYDLEILIRTKKTGDGITQVEKEVNNFDKALTKLAAGGLLLGAGRQLLKFGQDSIRTASDIEEMQSKFNIVFGDLGDKVTAELDSFAGAAKRSKFELQGYAATLQDTLKPMGIAPELAAEFSVELVKLGTDLSSFNNMPMDEALRRLQGTLIGSHENALAFGVVINENTLKAELAANGWDKLTGAQLEAAKVQARINLLTKGTVDAQGDAIRTADSYANQTKGMEAAVLDLQLALGQGLLPIMTDLVVVATEAAERLTVAAGAAGAYGDQVEEIIDGNIATAKSFDELVAEAQKIDDVNNIMGGLGTAVTGTSGAVREGLIDVTRQLAGASDGFGEFEAVIASWSAKSQNQFYSFLRAQGLTIEEFYEQEKAAYAVAVAIEELVPQTVKADEIMLRYAGSTGQAAVNTEALAAATAGADAVLLQNYGNVQKVEEGWRRLADAQQLAADLALVDPFKAAADPINELLDAQQLLADSEGEWVQRTISNAGRITAVNEQLATDLSDEQAKAYREILRTVDEGSAEWLDAYNRLQGDLTQSQRDALIAQQADLASQPDHLVDVYTGDAEGAEAAQERITAANEAIKQSYRETAAEAILAQSGVTQANLDLLVGIGYLTQEQADARLEFANTTTAIEELVSSQQFATLTSEEQTAALNALIEGERTTAEGAVGLAENMTTAGQNMKDARDAALGLTDELNKIPSDISVHIGVTSDPIPTFPTGPGSGQAGRAQAQQLGGTFGPNRLYRVGEGNLPEIGMIQSSGKLFMIPGERGQTFGNSQAKGLLGGGFTDNSQTTLQIGSDKTAALVTALTDSRKRSRMDQYMGIR